MGYRELITHLRKESEEKIRQLWQNAENEAHMIRKEAFKKAEDIRNEYRKKLTKTAEDQEERVITDAFRTAMGIRLSAQAALSERLRVLSLSVLNELRQNTYHEVFADLVREIHDSKWIEVKVNPEDASIARQYFPDAHVMTDSTISGGLEVIGNEGKTHVVNTFEKRLEKAWQDMLPLLIKDVVEELPDYDAHSAS